MQTIKVLVRHARYRWKQRNSALQNGRSLVKKLADGAPLLAAIVAPLATLYAIPALTMDWYSLDKISVPDPAASSILSAITLAFELSGNLLLFFRFSKNHKLRKRAAPTSTICYFLTTVLGVVNMSIFGAYRRDAPGYEYQDGFFCAVFSTMLSGLIALSLLYQLAYSVIVPKEEDDHTGTSSVETRLQARHFLITEGIFFATLALESLLLSRIEQTWSFFDAVYFSSSATTTCGFGADFAPRKAASRVLLFPFAIITISGLAVMISTIAKYTASSPETRKHRWKAIYEARTEKEKQNGKPADELIAEVKFLEKANRQEKSLSRLYDLLLSMFGFAIFWGIGALCFTAVEPWTYGEALYFGYIFFLTIGLGDFYPSTPASRVFFVFYAFVATPTVASFFLQAFSQVIEAMTDKRMEKEKARKGLKPKVAKDTTIGTHHEKGDPEQADENAQDHEDEFRPFVSHAELVERYHKQFSQKGIELSSRKLKDAIKDEDRDGKQEERVCSGGDESTEDDAQASEGDAASEDKTLAAREETDPIEKNTDEILAKGAKAAIKGDEGNPDLTSDDHPDFAKAMLDELLLHSLHLETIARKMIISKLPPDSQVRLVLQADKHLMQRAIHSHEEGRDGGADSEIDCRLSGKKESDLEQMHMYRESFARMLVSATKLKKLMGKEQLIFERRRGPIYQNGQPVPPDE